MARLLFNFGSVNRKKNHYNCSMKFASQQEQIAHVYTCSMHTGKHKTSGYLKSRWHLSIRGNKHPNSMSNIKKIDFFFLSSSSRWFLMRTCAAYRVGFDVLCNYLICGSGKRWISIEIQLLPEIETTERKMYTVLYFILLDKLYVHRVPF